MAAAKPYVTVEQARTMPGLRIAFTQGVPGPWGQAIREILDLKGVDYVPVIQEGGAPNDALREWTGQTSAPVAVLGDERPRSHWSELLMLAERLAPEPRLVPADEGLRMDMFGILHELCAEDGLGWSARLIVLDILDKAGATDVAAWMRGKFASGAALDHAAKRVAAITQALSERMTRQLASGSEYLVGDALTAADIYWTSFSNMLQPFPHDICPMPKTYRSWSQITLKATVGALPDKLLQHRERILRRYLNPPMWF